MSTTEPLVIVGGGPAGMMAGLLFARAGVPVTVQRAIHQRVLGAAIAKLNPRAPLTVRLLDRAPLLRRIPGRVLGLGIRGEHIRSPVSH
ncbi:FAD-dependent monooxygenase [Sphingomonas sp. ID0503]|uniref:FAD-dependent monooxygenase n=1 Tax=Sphingomonas sp. ID0503 TaxID=3399691 RepID=UPI003AFAF13B